MKRVAVRMLVVGLLGLLSWTGLFVSTALPSFAATSNQGATQETVISPDSQSYSSREEAYEKAVEAVNDPTGMEKEYQKDIKIFKQEHPDQKNLVEEAKKIVEKATDK